MLKSLNGTVHRSTYGLSGWVVWHEIISNNPFAEDWYVELIQSLCAEYGLKCHGRSELYTKMET